ncbi:MAG: SRPBCC family protein [Ignavibacteriae bacterium]|nr:SRPBCC family protein [Ignavibacteriota bacterium]
MKILKTVGLTVLFIIIFSLIIALFVSNEIIYEKSTTISSPIDSVWENVNSLADLDKWSPWNDYDPNMKKELTGVDGTVGAKVSWDSDNENLGKGSQTISGIEAPTLFETDLKFYTPFESKARGYIKLLKEENRTTVTWGFKSEMPYPFNLMKLFMDMEEAMDKDWNKGLSKLKYICEK